MTNEQKIQLADLVLRFFSDLPAEEKIDLPLKMVGTLQSPQGFNGFKRAEIGTPVFELRDRYLLFFETINGDRSIEVAYYRDTLKPYINFSNE